MTEQVRLCRLSASQDYEPDASASGVAVSFSSGSGGGGVMARLLRLPFFSSSFFDEEAVPLMLMPLPSGGLAAMVGLRLVLLFFATPWNEADIFDLPSMFSDLSAKSFHFRQPSKSIRACMQPHSFTFRSSQTKFTGYGMLARRLDDTRRWIKWGLPWSGNRCSQPPKPRVCRFVANWLSRRR